MGMRGRTALAITVIVAVIGTVVQRDSAVAATSLLSTLTTPNPDVWDDAFGTSVSAADVNGDGKADAIVGAPNETIGANSSQGRVYVFSNLSGAPRYSLTTPDPQMYSEFGYTVATGDTNGDGKSDVIASAPFEDVGGNSQQGRVYVFSGADGSLIYALNTPNPQAGANFGISLAAGDVNGDGKNEIVVGAPYESVNGNYMQGRVYVFAGADDSLLYTLNTPNTANSPMFGRGVALGDMDADGKADIVVGSPHETVGVRLAQGRAYVFSGINGSPLLTLTTPNPQNAAYFGRSVAIADINGDGRGDPIVGAPVENVGGNVQQGRSYAFSGADGTMLRTWTTPNAEAGADFGVPVLTGDVNGDGKPDIIVGASRETVGGVGMQGRTYVFSGSDNELLLVLNTPNPVANDYFGEVAAVGDMNGDGKADVTVGVAHEVPGGRAYVFAGSAGCVGDSDCDGCSDASESSLAPPIDPLNKWDFYSVPVPALFAAPNPTTTLRDSVVAASDAQAVFGYFKKAAKTGSFDYEQDLNGNGIKDGLEYDRSVVGPGRSGPPDGTVTATDAQLAFAQFKFGYKC